MKINARNIGKLFHKGNTHKKGCEPKKKNDYNFQQKILQSNPRARKRRTKKGNKQKMIQHFFSSLSMPFYTNRKKTLTHKVNDYFE